MLKPNRYFAVAALILFVVIGSLMFLLLRQQELSHMQAHAQETQRTVSGLLAQALLPDTLSLLDANANARGVDELALSQIEDRVSQLTTALSIVRVNIWSPTGALLYSTERILASATEHDPTAEAGFAAAAAGQAHTALLNDPSFHKPSGEIADLYLAVSHIPIRSQGATSGGVLELYQDVSEQRYKIEAFLWKTGALIAVALVALYLLTLTIVRHLHRSLLDHEAKLSANLESLSESSEQLQRERNFSDTIIESSGGVLIALDAQGNIVRINSAVVNKTGFAQHELIGKPIWQQLIPQERVEDVRRVFDNLMHSAIPSEHENEWMTKDGRRVMFHWYNSTLADKAGQVQYVIAQGHDITELTRAQHQLELQSGRLSATLEKTPNVAIQWYDEQGRIQYWNPASERLYGFTQDEVLGKPQDEVNHTPEEAAYYLSLANQCRAMGQAIGPAVFPVHDKDGNLLYVEATIFPIPADDKSQLVVCMDVDVTQREVNAQELQRHRQHLEELVATRTEQLAHAEALAHLGSWSLDLVTNKLQWSAETHRIFGLPRQALTINDFFSCIHPLDKDLVQEAWQAALAGAPYNIEHRILVDGVTKWVREIAHVVRAADGQALMALGSVQDISSQKASEAATRDAMEQAQNLAQMKSAFLANMSHEIRTPLNGIIGLARIGVRENQGLCQHRYEQILSSSQHLLGVVNDILDFSKIEAGKLCIDAQPIRLGALVDDSLSMVGAHAAEKMLKLEHRLAADLPEWIKADSLHIKQILTNLLANAIKFSHQGVVRLEVKRAQGLLLFQVCDQGIGMTEEQQTRLFKPFEQADSSTTRQFGGSGLGLAISMNLAKAMQGDIQVHSQAGVGSCFTLSLPLVATAAPAQTKQQGSKSHKRLRGIRVLAAEDVEINRLVLEDMLTQEGASHRLVENGLEAVELFKQQPKQFDVALMDVQMPMMDGREATRQIHAIYPGLPIIALTAHTLDTEREANTQSGMVDHLTKPIHVDELVRVLLRHVGSHDQPAPTPETNGAEEPRTTPMQPDNLPLLDWSMLLSNCGGSEDFANRLLRLLIEHHSQTPASLVDAREQQDYEQLGLMAHKLAGVFGTLKSQPLYQLAKELEGSARNQQAESLTLAGRLSDETNRFIGEVRLHLGNL